MKHDRLTKQDITFIQDNYSKMTVANICNIVDKSYSCVYKYIKLDDRNICYDDRKKYNKERHLYTKKYHNALFNHIKKFKRELTESSPDWMIELIKNMEQEYQHSITCTKSEVSRFKYQNLGSSMMNFWRPKLVIVEEKINS